MKCTGISAALLVIANLAGCGDDAAETKAVSCTGASCVCPAGHTCTLSQTACGSSSCSLKCNDHATCGGSCGESCSIDCSGGSKCTVTVGNSGSVTCTDKATCNVTCGGSCSLTCGSGSNCMIKCSGESDYKSIPEGGSC